MLFGLGALPMSAVPAGVWAAPDPATVPDMTPWVAEALRGLAGQRNAVLRLPAGELHFFPARALRRHLYISNNDAGTNAIVFPLIERDGLAIEGSGSTLIFHGCTTPFAVIASRNVTLRGLTIDWATPFHVEGDVVAVDPNGCWVELDVPAQFSYRVGADGRFFFVNEGCEQEGIKNLLAFDPERRESAFKTTDEFLKGRDGGERKRCFAEAIAPRRLRLTLSRRFNSVPATGQRLLLMPPRRIAPAVFVSDSSNIALEDVVIRHAGAMGLIAQTSRDIALERCVVAPAPDSGRFVSTTVDATHFVNCSGRITIRDCSFANHIDDAVNVHGIYQRVVERLPDGQLRTERAEYQQRGIETVRTGDVITLADGASVNVYHRSRVTAAHYPDDRYALLTLDAPPARVRQGDVVNTVSRQAGLSMEGCTVARNRARGVLVSTLGPVTLRNNRFHTPGSAIRISGGVDLWYESGPTSDVLIAGNLFENCKYGIWGKSVIDIECVDANRGVALEPYHGNVRIEHNRFIALDPSLVSAYRVRRLRFAGNRVERSTTYPVADDGGPPVRAEVVGSLELDGNAVGGFGSAATR